MKTSDANIDNFVLIVKNSINSYLGSLVGRDSTKWFWREKKTLLLNIILYLTCELRGFHGGKSMRLLQQ